MSLEHGMKKSVDTATRSALDRVESDGRMWTPVVGAWAADGTKLTTTTARTSDPRIVVREPYTDFDIQSDVGYGDAIYVRYVNESNWIRITQHQQTSSSSYACNPYACNPVACNPYACNPVACNGYACNPVACNGYACNPYACNPYSCNPYACNPYNCNGYQCNCTQNYATATQYSSGRNCTGGGNYFSSRDCTGCGQCCYYVTGCPSGMTQQAWYCATFLTCSQPTTTTCQTCYSTCYDTCYQTCYGTCYQTCYQTCYSTCYQTCYSTCYQTCYSTCYETCWNYYYPVYLRLEKFVGGVLTVVQEVGLGENARASWVRVTGKGDNIQVFSDRSPATAHINQNVADHARTGNGYGVGRTGYGNQDSGAVLDNINIKPFGQPG